MKYTDVENSWNFGETGDLVLTNNYLQSLNNRFKCSKEHLQIYYKSYGSDLMKMIGTRYDRDEALFILNTNRRPKHFWLQYKQYHFCR
mgnify:CR=1 FL=1